MKKNKTAIVTGGAMGYKAGGESIGGAISIKLAEEGFNVIIADLGEMGQRTVELIKENGGEGIFLKLDVTNTNDIKKIIDTAKTKYGGLHCLVNCVAHYSG